ncbi:MAG: hypothetical protein JWL81_2287, partial [Verrucomicrobiales bacterium]|nr:hypothetical protein [Verrucomicrobiales bacterium]
MERYGLGRTSQNFAESGADFWMHSNLIILTSAGFGAFGIHDFSSAARCPSPAPGKPSMRRVLYGSWKFVMKTGGLGGRPFAIGSRLSGQQRELRLRHFAVSRRTTTGQPPSGWPAGGASGCLIKGDPCPGASRVNMRTAVDHNSTKSARGFFPKPAVPGPLWRLGDGPGFSSFRHVMRLPDRPGWFSLFDSFA